MGFITDILKDIPVNAVLRSKLEELEKRHEEIEAEIKVDWNYTSQFNTTLFTWYCFPENQKNTEIISFS